MNQIGNCKSCEKLNRYLPASLIVDGVALCMKCLRGSGIRENSSVNLSEEEELYVAPVKAYKPTPRAEPVRFVDANRECRLCLRGCGKLPHAGMCSGPAKFISPAKTREVEERNRKAMKPFRDRTELVFEISGKHLGRTKQELLTHSHSHYYVHPRQVVHYILHRQELSYTQIGRVFKMHHTTVMHGVEQIRKRVKQDASIRDLISRIEDEVGCATAERSGAGVVSALPISRPCSVMDDIGMSVLAAALLRPGVDVPFPHANTWAMGWTLTYAVERAVEGFHALPVTAEGEVR